MESSAWYDHKNQEMIKDEEKTWDLMGIYYGYILE